MEEMGLVYVELSRNGLSRGCWSENIDHKLGVQDNDAPFLRSCLIKQF
jgi:hypothetical protein